MWVPVVLLLISNCFMTFAWYGFLRFKGLPLIVFILISWGVAFFEYCFAVPANRIGISYFTPTQLKIMQEAIAITIFILFSIFYLKDHFKLNYALSLLCIGGAVFFAFK